MFVWLFHVVSIVFYDVVFFYFLFLSVVFRCLFSVVVWVCFGEGLRSDCWEGRNGKVARHIARTTPNMGSTTEKKQKYLTRKAKHQENVCSIAVFMFVLLLTNHLKVMSTVQHVQPFGG